MNYTIGQPYGWFFFFFFKVLTLTTPNVVYEYMTRRTFDVTYLKEPCYIWQDWNVAYLPCKYPHTIISYSRNCLNVGLQNVHLIWSLTSRGLYYVNILSERSRKMYQNINLSTNIWLFSYLAWLTTKDRVKLFVKPLCLHKRRRMLLYNSIFSHFLSINSWENCA